MQDLLNQIRDNMNGRSVDGSLKFDCGDDGVIVLENGSADDQDRDTDCTLRLSRKNLEKLLAGDLNPMTATMMGKLKVSGDIGLAMKFAQLLK
ncbi:MAG: SCP2 sterol-binding domain-containing protein [Pelagimonas sp.]|jgi:putative sterol carrier protein|nr:SCP2 sterol-binding domain-containing protein [Pelagimonas sp.]